MLPLIEVILKSPLFQLENLGNLFHLLVLYGPQLRSHELPHLNSLSPRDTMIMQNIYITHPLLLELVLKFFAPVVQEIVPRLQILIDLLLQSQLLLQQVHLQLVLSHPIVQLILHLVNPSLQLQNFLLVAADHVVQAVLLHGIGSLEFPYLFSIGVSQRVDFVDQLINFLVLQ